MSEKQKVTFYCERYPTLEITIVPLSYSEGKGGRRIKTPGKKALFQRLSGTLGEFTTDDPEVIEGVKASNFYRAGLVFNDAERAKKIKAKPAEDKLVQGTVGSKKEEALPPAPVQGAKPVKAAKAPKRGKAAEA